MSAAAPLVSFDRAEAQTPEVAAALTGVAEISTGLANVLAMVVAAARRTGTYTPEELLTLEQVGEVLHCSERKAREWVESYCPVVSVGNLPRVRRADLDAAIRRQARPYAGRRS